MAMAKKQFKSKHERDLHVVALYEELGSMQKVADRIGLSKAGVYKILKKMEGDKESKQVVAKVKKQVEKARKLEYDNLIDVISSARVSYIVQDALDLMTKENMEAHIAQGKMQSVTNLIGMLFDKTIKVKQLEVEKANIELRTKEISQKRVIIFEGEDDVNDKVKLPTTYS